MAFRFADLRWIVAESMTLSERLGADIVPGGSGPTGGVAGERLRKWRSRVASGDPSRFDRRLRWEGLDTESALGLLGPVRMKAARSLPAWARFLDAALSDPAGAEEPPGGVLDADAPEPFEELLWRLVPEAARRVRAGLGPCRDRLSPAGARDLERGLLRRICRTAARALCAEFDAFRAARSKLPIGDARETPARGRQIYRDFLHALDGDGLVGWLLRYPMLARLLATCCQQWIASTVDLLRRLDRDAEAIRDTFGIGEPTLRIASVTPDLSDPHREGRTVCLLRFESGANLVYKPRPLTLDRLFGELLTEVDRTCGQSVTRRLKIVDRGDYGWVEFVEATPCADRTAAERFYRRAGMLTCLVYALGGSDVHAGNVIACGEHPVPIDLECIVGAPLAAPRRGKNTEPSTGRSPAGSVFLTGMPPTTRRGSGGVFRFVGGLADPDPHGLLEHPTAHTNTDWMAWRGGGGPGRAEHNLPVAHEGPQPASGYVEQILDGFRSMYHALSRDRSRLRAARPLRQLEREEFRVLIRDTRSYVALLDDALIPQHLTSGPDWSIALDIITAPSLAATERPPCWTTLIAERTELERLDIPLFAGSAVRRALHTSAGVELEQTLSRSGRSPRARLALLNAGDLQQQLDLLRLSFSIAGVKRRHRDRRVGAARRRGPEPLQGQHLLVEVQAIIDLLERLAVDNGAEVTWLGFGGPSADAPTLGPVGASLFSGTSGIALFLAAAAAVMSCGTARKLAARVFGALCHRVGDGPQRLALASAIGIGGAAGFGGIVYALARAGCLLGDSSYLAAARAAASAVTRAAIAEDETLDVLSGAAGALLGLLSLHGATGDGAALRRAVWCGEHLLERRLFDPATGLHAWRTAQGRLATGFAHGSTGIAFALGRLAGRTGRDEFLHAATEVWEQENRRRSPRHTVEVKDVPATPGSSPARRRSWCRGSVGIGLARLGSLDDTDPQAGTEVEADLESIQRSESAEPDGLCCGRMGHADFLLSAGLRLGRQDLRRAAAIVGRQTLTRALAEGRFATGTDEGFRPGLFQGVSGIGYELLRMHAPRTVPSVLLWE